MIGSPIGGSCIGNTGNAEKCDQPVIPSCVDRNFYCSTPPGGDFIIKKFKSVEILFNKVELVLPQ